MAAPVPVAGTPDEPVAPSTSLEGTAVAGADAELGAQIGPAVCDEVAPPDPQAARRLR